MLQVAFSRVGFWRALVEVTLLANVIFAGPYLIGDALRSPWVELLSFVGLAVYVYAAWRLAPGQGGLWPNIGRVVGWLLIFTLVNGVLGWALITYFPWKGRYLGIRLEDISFGLDAYLLSAGFVISSIFLPTRLLVAAWELGQRRLRWRLTFSYLLIGVLTNILVPVALLLYVAVLSLTAVPAIFPPDEVTPRLAAALGPSVAAGVSPGQLDPLLRGLLDGSTRLPQDPAAPLSDQNDLSGGGVRRLTLLSLEGIVLAGAGEAAHPAGEGLPEADVMALRLLIDRALATRSCVDGRPADGPIPDTAVCPVAQADDGAPAALLLVESNIDSSAQAGAAFSRVVTVTLLGTSLTLNLTAFVLLALLPIALGVGYLLARQLTRRLERLDQAAGALAAGRPDQPVPIDSQDEIGRLGETFNRMASQLAEREQALAETAARAETLLRANRRLVADVSHELRNPLATLRGYLEALELEHAAQLPAHDMQVIQTEMQRLTSLVDDLFTLARAEAQQLSLNIDAVDAGALMRRLADTLAPLARREREIELVARLPARLPAVHADQARLEQVLRNLAQNALRHTPTGGIIVFEASEEEGCVALAVADTGVGIAPEDLPHVFERFYRGDSSRARETGGAGLGLSLVRELVTAMGGTVAVESTPGRGSRFVVRLRAVV